MAKRPTGKRNKVLTARNYVHQVCGAVTKLDGPEFQTIANPLAEMGLTYCSECEEDDDLSQFHWEDTDECITDYCARHCENIPDEVLEQTSHDQVMKYAIRGGSTGGIIAIVLGTLVGAATSLLTGIITGVVLTLIAVPLLAILNFMKFEKKIILPLLEEHLGVKDVGELR